MNVINTSAAVAADAVVSSAADVVEVKVKSFFKKSKSGANAGVKRADLHWSFAGVSAASVTELPSDQIAKVVNSFIESFGRKLIAANGDDWSFVPTAETVNFATAFADFTAERSSGRILTKESLGKFADLYVSVMVRTETVPVKAANVVRSLIVEKFASIAGKADVVEAISNRISQFCELASDDELEPFADVVDALIGLLEELSVPAEITIDAI